MTDNHDKANNSLKTIFALGAFVVTVALASAICFF